MFNHENINLYLNEDKEFPYCVGCGHTMINKAVASAMAKSGLKATQINLISDIGCVGLVDKMFLTNTIHTTHGRSTAFATGIQLADEILFQTKKSPTAKSSDARLANSKKHSLLDVNEHFEDERNVADGVLQSGCALNVVMIGDGGATIGLLHLVEAARMNANITVVLHNNFVYGMTGGQNSGLTPENFRTATTLSGSIVPNIHIAKLLEAAHAGFIARKLATDRDLDDVLLEAYNYDGFALVEIIELCTGYATKWNPLSKKDIEIILENTDQEERGVIVKKDSKSFAKRYSEAYKAKDDYRRPASVKAKFQTKEAIDLNIIISGTAGEGVQFTASTFAKSLVKQSLNISQKNDNPVTIGTGYSVSELKVSSEEIYYSAIDSADYILISTQDGFHRIISEIKKETTVIIDSSVYTDENKQRLEKIGSKVMSFDYRSQLKDKRLTNFKLIDELYKLEPLLNKELLLETINETGKASEEMLASISV
jgi:2-oxoglutarate/2-oxoacid ferredoxin oxidoreductase subunit beta